MKRHIPSFFIFTVSLSFFVHPFSSAQDGRAAKLGTVIQLRRDVFTTQQGLPGNSVRDIVMTQDGNIWAATSEGIGSYDGKTWKSYGQKEGLASQDVLAIAGNLWAATPSGVFAYASGKWSFSGSSCVPASHYAKLSSDSKGKVYWTTTAGLCVYEKGKWNKLELKNNIQITAVKITANDRALLGTSQGLMETDGKTIFPVKLPEKGCEWLKSPIADIDFKTFGPVAAITAYGIMGWDGAECRKASFRVPFADATVLNNGVIGTSRGFYFPAASVAEETIPYFAGRRWLPHDHIQALFVNDKEESIWAGTPGGLAKVHVTKITLEDKAIEFEKRIRERHVKQGFVRELQLNVPGNPARGGFLPHSDNDGLWTSLYVAAMSFKYAVTKDEKAREWARESFRALEELQEITGTDGFFARSIVEKGEPEKFKYGGEWHVDKSGKWEWKGDTSSDELDGHFFAYPIFFDLAADEKDKERVRKLVRKIMDHIIKNNWRLIDVDGKPTRWGVWNPAQINDDKPIHGLPDETWWQERGLNPLEILSHLKTAYHITGDEKYQKAYLELIEKHHYAENTITQKITEPPDEVNHSDDELAFLAYYPLLLYEKDPELLEIYKKSLKRSWDIEAPEKNPWWNFTYCAFMEGDCRVWESVDTLRQIPWEQLNYRMENSHRLDVQIDPKFGRFGELQSTQALPYTETCILRWNGNPYRLDSCGGENEEGDGVLFLLPYWMGRYHGFIVEQGK